MQLTKTQIGLSSGKKMIVYHNLDDYRLKLAVDDFLKTGSVSVKKLVRFINKKSPAPGRVVAFTEKEYKQLLRRAALDERKN